YSRRLRSWKPIAGACFGRVFRDIDDARARGFKPTRGIWPSRDLAISRRGGEDCAQGVCVKELEEKLQQIQQALDAQDRAGFVAVEEAMLTCVIERAGNQTLMSFIRTLWARSRYYKMVGVKDLIETGNVALLYDEAAQFVAGATTQDENMALDALLTALKRAEAGIRAELG